MFDIGFSELFVIAIVALLVLGPERLPRAARFAGLWVRRARAQWHSVRSELEDELADEELKRNLQRTQEALREARQQLHAGGAQLQRDLERERSRLGQDLGRMDSPRSPPQGASSGDPTSVRSTADSGTGPAPGSGPIADVPGSGTFELKPGPPRHDSGHDLGDGDEHGKPAGPGDATPPSREPGELESPGRESAPARRDMDTGADADADTANQPPPGPRP